MSEQAPIPVGPVLVDVVDAARLLGIGRTLAYELIRSGEWPTPVVRVRRLIKIPVQPLLDYAANGSPQHSEGRPA